MERFLERHANKISAQELIKANEAAEAARREQMEKQNRQYEEELSILRQNAQKMEERLERLEGIEESIGKRIDQSDEATHDVGVRIYRNVQASVIEEQNKQMDSIREDFQKQMDGIRGEFSVLLRRLDTTRNQLEEEYRNNNQDKTKGIIPLGIIVLLVSLADLVINVLRILGLV